MDCISSLIAQAHGQREPHHHDGSLQKRAALRDKLAELVNMPESHSRPLTSDDEHHAFKVGQPIWIRYEDKSGMVTERVIEIYRPSDDEVIYTWLPEEAGPAHLRPAKHPQLAAASRAFRL